MKLWMDVMRDIEHVMDDHERLFDAWEEGGVDGLVIGPMMFRAARLMLGARAEQKGPSPVPTFDPNLAVYRSFGVKPPAPPSETLEEQRLLLEKTLSNAKERGWAVWIFQPGSGAGPGGDGHIFADEESLDALCARMVDTFQHFPMVDGGILDGPEWGYEIAPHHMNHRSYFFNDLPESVAPKCKELGYEYMELAAARDHLLHRFHNLEGHPVDRMRAGGFLNAFEALDADAGLVAWFHFRQDSLTDFYRKVQEKVSAALSRPVKIGMGPRTGSFAPLCGYDFQRLGRFMDVLLPKHYFWNRGFDGLVGTVRRYVETLNHWNAGLSDADALAVVRALFGLEFPGVTDRLGLETVISSDTFEAMVTRETRLALEAVADAEKIVPWVDAGRAPHDGDPMAPGDLLRLLQAAGNAGLERFLYHHHSNLTPGEWAVMSAVCGKPWKPLESEYAPQDQLVL